jgi:mannosyltransferase
VFLDRYVICSTLGVVGLAAVGADAVRARVGPVVAAAILVVPVVVGARHVAALERAPYKYEDPPAVIALVNGAARPGDALGFGGGGLRIVIDAYVRSGDPLPTDVARGAGAGQGAYAAEVDPATLRRRLASVDRLWLITDPTDRRFPSAGPWASLRSEVAADFSVQSANTTPGIDVTLYVRRAPA